MQLLMLPNPKHITLEKHFKYINSVSLFQQFYCRSLTPYLRHYSVEAYGLGGSEQNSPPSDRASGYKSLAYDKANTSLMAMLLYQQ